MMKILVVLGLFTIAFCAPAEEKQETADIQGSESFLPSYGFGYGAGLGYGYGGLYGGYGAGISGGLYRPFYGGLGYGAGLRYW
ncbi:keratin-associated protein 19-2-like [Artemia franciscana]|uniref:keratin-associated protein 19-2-like n=1 Tax=Artemia franciscana TaxID=6661 RepID=UPI0032DA2E9D